MPRPTRPVTLPVQDVAYSYQRFSNPSQATGDSARRQDKLRDAWLGKTGVPLDTSLTFRDEGVSAFNGKHRQNPDRHALAAFLELVRRGRIRRGSHLIVESLDRLTREHIRPALTLLLNLIDAGIRVVQLLPVEAVYDEDVEPMQLMMAIMELSRGHSESLMKSGRVGEAWAEKKKMARGEKRPLGRKLPGWVRLAGAKRDGRGRLAAGRLELIPERAAAVRRVFALALAGHGLGAITKKLNTEGVPPIGRADYWARSYVNKILTSRAVTGEYQPHRRTPGGRVPDGPPVPGFFPEVVNEDRWHAAQAALGGRRLKGGRPGTRVNIFSGVLRDARDGGPLHHTDKGGRSSGPVLAPYRAANGMPGARMVSFPAETFEQAVLSQLREVDPRDVLPEADEAADRVGALAGRYAALEARVEKIKAQLIGGDDITPLVEVLRAVDAERAAVGEELAAARRKAASPLSEAWGEYRGLLDALDAAPDLAEARTRLRAAVRRVVREVWCLFCARGMVRLAAVQVLFEGGDHRDYLVVRRAGHGSRSYAGRKAAWWVRSFPGAGPGPLDFRNPKDVKAVEKFLTRLDLSGA